MVDFDRLHHKTMLVLSGACTQNMGSLNGLDAGTVQ